MLDTKKTKNSTSTNSNALLVGNFGSHNMGDEMILCAALKSYPDSIVMSFDSRYSQKFCEQTFKTLPFPPLGFRSFLKYLFDSNFRKSVLEIKRHSIKKVIFPGGGLFAIHTKACVTWFLTFVWLKILLPKKTPFYFTHQGIDQNLSFIGKKLLKWVMQRAYYISVRDLPSQKALKNLNIEATLTQDRVFELKTKNEKSKSKRLLINAIKPLNKNQWEKIKQKFPDFSYTYLATSPKDIKFAPPEISVQVPKTKRELTTLLSNSQILIGERLHALILGSIFCTQTKLLRAPYSEKVQNFCKEHNISEV